jgi:hypothetical protein
MRAMLLAYRIRLRGSNGYRLKAAQLQFSYNVRSLSTKIKHRIVKKYVNDCAET